MCCGIYDTKYEYAYVNHYLTWKIVLIGWKFIFTKVLRQRHLSSVSCRNCRPVSEKFSKLANREFPELNEDIPFSGKSHGDKYPSSHWSFKPKNSRSVLVKWAARLSEDISTRVRWMARTASGSRGLFPVPGRKRVWKFAGSNCEKISSVSSSESTPLVGRSGDGGVQSKFEK